MSSLTTTPPKPKGIRNYTAFWIFGICNNFVNITMLVAAQDILNKHKEVVDLLPRNLTSSHSDHIDECLPNLEVRKCSPHSAGIVLFCNVFPGLIIKLAVPFIASRFPYGIRHTLVCLAQATALSIVALSDNVSTALMGVMLASMASGLGECTFLALASHYKKHTISSWSSGTGVAGMVAAVSYASLTDPQLLGLAPTYAILLVLIIPCLYFITYTFVLEKIDTLGNVKILEPITWIGMEGKSQQAPENEMQSVENTKKGKGAVFPKAKDGSRWTVIRTLLKYMIPLFAVYFAEYFINQGLVELIVFDCDHGLEKSPRAQYRWYQVVYRTGVFLSRSSGKFIQLGMCGIAMMPILQLLNVAFFLTNAIHTFVPHFGIMVVVVFYEGLIGGAAYVNSFGHIHKKIDPQIKEFALSVVSLADSTGILFAALTAIPVHNAICAMAHV